mgnify:CR=1 FL=1
MFNEPRVLLLYPPEQNWPETLCKPNGSLAYPMLGGALRDIDVDVEVYDACVGNSDDDFKKFFFILDYLELEFLMKEFYK